MFKSVLRFAAPKERMALPNLRIPSQNLSRPKPYLKPKALEKWAMELPIGNSIVATQQVILQLRHLNAARYPIKERLALHNCLRPYVSEVFKAMHRPLRLARLPLDTKHRYSAQLNQELLEQMAIGYKLVVSELALQAQLKEYDKLLLQEAIYLSIAYLSQRLVDAYSVYDREPEYVWLDINQLYQYAEAQDLHLQAIDDPYPDTALPVNPNIDHAYKRILLLSLSEPYHLMQFEAEDVYHVIAPGATDTRLENRGTMLEGEYVIDLDDDFGPQYISDEINWNASDGRVIDISKIKQRLEQHLQRLIRANMYAPELEMTTLLERRQRDMLLRLSDAWSASLVRRTQRFMLEGMVQLTSSLNACHYFISDKTPFTPEMDELKLVTPGKHFTDEDDSIFANVYREALQKDRKHTHTDYRLNPWWQRNVSPVGISLNCGKNCHHIEPRVGEIVAYRYEKKHPKRWQIGVIRWMQAQDNDTERGEVNIGIMNLANGAVSVGTKAVSGLGVGTDYFRGLMVPKQVALNQIRSLLVPALLYDVGTILTLNMKQRLFHVRLTRMLLSTRAFSQFEFEVVNKPMDFYL